MKPIKLIISAIGPYADKMPEINFEQFEDKGLFLITGDTGAGKTTIFDAICFALYGTTSGIYRDTKNLRSEYADDMVESYVDFYFLHQGKEYHVWRRPSYEVKKKRGEGYKTQNEKAILYEEGQLPNEGRVSDVNNAIKNLLHIDDEKFKQIAMIAQGEFQKLLNAETKDRTKILRTIFDTEGYNDMESILKDHMDKSNRERNSIESSIIQYFKDVTADETTPLFKELQELQEWNGTWSFEKNLGLIENIISSDNDSLKNEKQALEIEDKKLRDNQASVATAQMNNKYVIQLEKLQKEKKNLEDREKEIADIKAVLKLQKSATRLVNPTYSNWSNKAGELAATRKLIETKSVELEKAKSEAEIAQNKLEEANKQQPKADLLQKNADKINNEHEKYTQRDELSIQLRQLSDEEEAIIKAETAIKSREGELVKRIQTLKNTVEELKGKPEEMANIKADGDKLSQLQESINKIIDERIPARTLKQNDFTKKQDKFIQARLQYDNASNDRIKAERILENCRAGLLAQNLKEGEKCPVCGADHHPELAKLPEKFVTEEDLKKYQKIEITKQEAKTNAIAEVEASKSALQQINEQLEIDIKDCLENPILDIDIIESGLDELIDMLRKAKTTVDLKKNDNSRLQIALLKECSDLKKAEQDLGMAQGEESRRLEKDKGDLSKRKLENTSKKSKTKASLDMLNDLSYPDWETAKKELDTINVEVETILESITRATKSKNQADSNVNLLSGELNGLKSNLETQKNDEEKLKKKLDDIIKSQNFSSIEEMLTYVVSEDDITKSEDCINKYNQSVATNKERLAQAKIDAEGKELVDEQALKAICEEQNKIVETVRTRVNTIEQRIKNNTAKRDNIAAKRTEYEKSQKEYSIYNKLYSLVKGQASSGKITLEQYIQVTGFDGIIAAANRRLLPMSDGQFELYRRGNLGKRSNTSLDLEVLDNYTGRMRPVGSLSGGESFKASLSLALGLSDTVSSNIGGIQMDALFVDEGFGTLDRKSIENAMEILVNLSGKNKLVGIISHRDELKENIPQQIKVKKTREGSQISIELGL
jgi:exonuclease SbcC